MRVLALVPSLYDTSPGQRFRLEQWERQLHELGVKIVFAPFEDAALRAVLYSPGRWGKKVLGVVRALGRRISLMSLVRNYDAVYVFRETSLLGAPIFERWVHHVGVPLIFDFDDAVFVPYKSPSNGWLSILKGAGKTRTICRLATHVMAGNGYLAEYASLSNPNVTVIPTTIDTDKYRVEPLVRASDVPVIGWTGSYSTVQHLDMLRLVLRQLASSERFYLKVIGTSEYELDGVNVEAIPWKSSSEIADLRPLDIGIMPLPEDRWTRGKCGLKALQYMALGIPTVCSPVGVNSEIIDDGKNGFLARTEEEWVDKLKRLLRSPTLRAELGAAGRSTVEDRYSAVVHTPRVCEIFRSVVKNCSPQLDGRNVARVRTGV